MTTGKKLLFAAVFLWLAALIPGNAPECKGFDPTAFSSSAPQALALAAMWSPHVANSLSSTGVGLYNIGKATVSILKLPWGLLQCTLGAPFGYFDSGVKNCWDGMVAPFELVLEVVLLPVRIISLGTVK